MLVAVEPLDADAAAIQLTERMLHLAAESRLRAARLYGGSFPPDPDADLAAAIEAVAGKPPILIVNVLVVERVSSVRIELHKPVQDSFGLAGAAATYITGSVGTHRDAMDVMANVSRALDQFLAGYLRVNEDACE